MVTPVLAEADWLPHLQALPDWHPPAQPLLIVAPHPDDETLACGGLIAALRERGLAVTILAVTDGENAYQANAGLAALRREEQTRALARLGVSTEHIVRLGFPDSSVAAHERDLRDAIARLLTPDTLVIAPSTADFHPDHTACARAAQAAALEANVPLLSCFFWMWHRGTPADAAGLDLCKLALTPAQRAAKLEALTCHHSQLEHAPEPEILPDDLLWPARLPFEVYAR